MQNKIKRKIKIISFIFISFIVIFCNCTPVLADYFNNNEKANLKEKQFLEKIKIIHQVFPNQTDEAALLATLSHRGELTSYITNSYEPNFDKKDYKEYMTSFKETADTIKNTEDGKYSQVNGDNTDILLAATIIMLDSSSWVGKYSDENYKKALAGNKLIGNMAGENDLVANGFNAIFCGVGAAVDTAATPIQFGADFLQGHGDTAIQNKVSRYVTMTNVCTQGYIGGTYSSVRTLEDDERKQAIKDKYAEEIIKLAKEFRGDEQDNCIYQSIGSGDATNWRQYDETWGNESLGSSSETIKSAGCTSTAMAYLIKKSGTSLSQASFNPSVFVKNTSYTSDGNLEWDTWTSAASNFKMNKSNQSLNGDDITSAAKKIEQELNTASGQNNQTFVIIQMTNHWVAVDHVENDTVYVLDPAAESGVGLVTLETALNRDGISRNLISYNTFYATDVAFGSTGPSDINGTSSNANYCGMPADGLSTDLGEGTRIDVPEQCPLRNGGTMRQSGIHFDDVEYTNFLTGGAALGWDAGRVYRAWVNAGTQSYNGLATLNGRYLAATSSMFGNTGDAVDVVLANGKVIKLVITDHKGSDAPSVWGHQQTTYSNHQPGISMVEWEGYNGYNSVELPKTYADWNEQPIQYVVNYGSYLDRLA